MRRPDDYSLDEYDLRRIRKEAEKCLRQANALGRFPTPVADIMDAARVTVASEDLLDEGFVAQFRRSAADAGRLLKRAIKKVLGITDVFHRVVYLARNLHVAKRPFIKLHETGHAVLPWHREVYALTEDCEETLRPDIAEQFEREASTFAADVLFQVDAFFH